MLGFKTECVPKPGYDYQVQFLPGTRGIRLLFLMTSVTDICTRSVVRAREVVERYETAAKRRAVIARDINSRLRERKTRICTRTAEKKLSEGGLLLRAHMQSPHFSCKSFPRRVQTVSPSVLHKHCTGEHTHAVLNVRRLRWNDDKEIVQGYCRKDDSPRLHFRTPRGPAVGWDIGTKKKNVLVLPEAICTHPEVCCEARQCALLHMCHVSP